MKRILAILLGAMAASMVAGAAAQAASNKTEIKQNLNIFNSLYKELQTNYVDSIDATKSIRNAIDAMLGQIDPYTEYYPEDELDNLRVLSTGEYSGIGSVIMQRNGRVELSEPQWNSPARKAGLRFGDRIVAIDGDTLPKGYTTQQASARLKGQAGSKVRLTIERPYVADSILDFEITRGQIRTNSVPYYGIVRDSIGYIRLTTFDTNSASEVKNAVVALKKDPRLRAIVLDLRDNGGGLLESATQIVGLFVPKGTEVVRTRYRGKNNEKIYKTTQQPVDTDIPLAVLINENTASSSEIVAGALQDLDRAIVVGNRSYGKGLVQSSRPLPYNGLLKVTVARYYIPSGRLIQAIDYSHRDENGRVTRIPDSLTNVYHTMAGREVRDGGGITPDITVKAKEMNRLMYNVIADFWAYDYANRFRARQGDTIAPADRFEISDSIYADFKNFIDPDRFKYDRMCESGMKYLREAAELEGYMTDSVAAQFDLLESMLKHDLSRDLDFNAADLRDLLDDEISARYYDDGARVMRALRTDPDLDAATAALLDPARYCALLAPKKE
ncbi:MAG: S41 family peptidase [Bacteroides sp.]|nr:S41 family peptidase [Bacteroides sp.]MCM1457439.1 S41 family peptidase [Lachnoclostridium sp.]